MDGARRASGGCLRFRAPRRRASLRARGEAPAVRRAPGLAAVAWDSLPPATSLVELAPDSSTTVALTARLARRGPARPMVALSERAGARRAVIAAGGLYRWAFRGGASAEAYRALVAGLVDWLLEQGAGSRQRFAPVTYETPNGIPLQWRGTGKGEPSDA